MQAERDSGDSRRELLRLCRELLPGAAPGSALEYFLHLLPRAQGAVDRGDYGVAAAVVVTNQGREVTSFASNHLFSQGDPLGHAESRALRQLAAYLRRPRPIPDWPGPGGRTSTRDQIVSRPATSPGQRFVVYTTLEPCPMCTIALLNAGATRVIIAAADKTGGLLYQLQATDGLEAWGELARLRGLEVIEAGPAAAEPFRLPLEVVQMCARVFDSTRPELDNQVVGGVLDRSRV